MTAPRLIVLGPSHYCERARWALDHAGIGYREIRWAVGPHLPLARRLAPQSSLPILDTGTAVIQGSDRILDWIGTDGGDAAVEQRLENVTGPLSRRLIYAATLADGRSGIRDALMQGVPTAQRWIAGAMWPLTRRLMVAKMNCRLRLLPLVRDQMAAELDWFDTIIGDHRHLVGERLGRADITAASLLAPLVRGPAVTPMYDRVRLPDELEQTLTRWNLRPSLCWVRHLYQTHRSYSPTRSR